MDGLVAPLDKICDLADKYDAMVMVDECHAAGFILPGTPEAKKGVMGRVDIITGTLGKALEEPWEVIHSKKEIIELLRQRSRPYFFKFVSAINC
jgi:glycine C-acetyltransferase